MDVHRASNEKRERAASMSKSGSGVECQPNAAAPLLRDEKSRRDWIEHELDMCCQVPFVACLSKVIGVEVSHLALTSAEPSLQRSSRCEAHCSICADGCCLWPASHGYLQGKFCQLAMCHLRRAELYMHEVTKQSLNS